MNEAGWVLLGMPVAMRHFPHWPRPHHRWHSSSASGSATLRRAAGFPRHLRRTRPARQFHADRYQRRARHADRARRHRAAYRRAQQLKAGIAGPVDRGHRARDPQPGRGDQPRLAVTRRITGPAGHRPAHDRDHPAQLASRERGGGEHPQAVAPAQPHPAAQTVTVAARADREDIRQTHRLGEEQLQQQIEPEGTTVLADPGQLRQAIDVLCDNAVRHFDRDPDQLNIAWSAA